MLCTYDTCCTKFTPVPPSSYTSTRLQDRSRPTPALSPPRPRPNLRILAHVLMLILLSHSTPFSRLHLSNNLSLSSRTFLAAVPDLFLENYYISNAPQPRAQGSPVPSGLTISFPSFPLLLLTFPQRNIQFLFSIKTLDFIHVNLRINLILCTTITPFWLWAPQLLL